MGAAAKEQLLLVSDSWQCWICEDKCTAGNDQGNEYNHCHTIATINASMKGLGAFFFEICNIGKATA